MSDITNSIIKIIQCYKYIYPYNRTPYSHNLVLVKMKSKTRGNLDSFTEEKRKITII